MHKTLRIVGLVFALFATGSVVAFAKESPDVARFNIIQKKDKARDAKLKEKTGQANEFRERFTTKQQAKQEEKVGLAPGTHLGEKVKPGRPLGQEKAAAQYGLPKKNAEVRSVWQVKKEIPRKTGKVIGGSPDKEEVVVKRRIRPENRVSSKPTEKTARK